MKKRIFTVLLIPSIIISALTACSLRQKDLLPVEIDEELAAHFEGCMTFDEIMKDIKNVDLYLEPDFSGLIRETMKDEENDTADYIYKDKKGNTIYILHEGYGENCFDYYTESSSGKDLKVTYESDGETGRWYAWIQCDDYGVTYYHIDRDEEYGAKELYVSIKKNSDYPVSEEISIAYQNGKWGSPEAFFCDEGGFEHFYSWEETNEEGNVETKSTVYRIHDRIENEPECNVDTFLDGTIGFTPEFIFGSHKLSYLDDPNGQWYLTADFILTFNTLAERDAFKTKYGIEDSPSLGNEDDYITLHTGEITIPISKDFEDFEWLVGAWEVDDRL